MLAFVLVWLVKWLIARRVATEQQKESGGSAQTLFVLSFSEAFLRVSIWVVTIVMIFSSLGFNVGAVLAGLGIGGLAIAMAANETLSNLIGGITIFIEKPFEIGDVIQVSGGACDKVIGMTWRSTIIQSGFMYITTIPNSQVAGSTIRNFSREKPPGDFISVYVSTEYDPQKVIAAMNQALEECPDVVQGKMGELRDTWVAGPIALENTTAMEYWPWWYINDYHDRYIVRNALWMYLWKHLTAAGISLEVKPFEANSANGLAGGNGDARHSSTLPPFERPPEQSGQRPPFAPES